MGSQQRRVRRTIDEQIAELREKKRAQLEGRLARLSGQVSAREELIERTRLRLAQQESGLQRLLLAEDEVRAELAAVVAEIERAAEEG